MQRQIDQSPEGRQRLADRQILLEMHERVLDLVDNAGPESDEGVERIHSLLHLLLVNLDIYVDRLWERWTRAISFRELPTAIGDWEEIRNLASEISEEAMQQFPGLPAVLHTFRRAWGGEEVVVARE